MVLGLIKFVGSLYIITNLLKCKKLFISIYLYKINLQFLLVFHALSHIKCTSLTLLSLWKPSTHGDFQWQHMVYPMLSHNPLCVDWLVEKNKLPFYRAV